MKSRAPLVMMEQMVMLLVFALAAALCVQMFVLSERLSKRNEATDRAVLEAQNTAESIKHSGVKAYLEEMKAEQKSPNVWVVYYAADWSRTKEAYAYYMEISYEEGNDFLWRAELIVFWEDGTELLRIPVAGQRQMEVEADA